MSSMPSSPKKILLRVRDRLNVSNPWGSVDNFQDLGWKVRSLDNTRWYIMGPENTRIRNPEHDPDTHAEDDPNYPLWLEPVSKEE